MTPLRQHMIAALQRSGKGERTQEASGREVRLLAQCSHTAPDRIAAQELQHSLLHRTHVDRLAPASMRLCSSGRRFCSPHVLQRDWHTLTRMRAHTAHHLPAVLRVQEVRRLLASATHRLEAGVNPRLIQRSLGHTQLDTTMVSFHLTHTGHAEASERLNALRHGLRP